MNTYRILLSKLKTGRIKPKAVRSGALVFFALLLMPAVGRSQSQELQPTPPGTGATQVWSPELDRYDNLGRTSRYSNDNSGSPAEQAYTSHTRLGNIALPVIVPNPPTFTYQNEMLAATIPDGYSTNGVIAVFEGNSQLADDQHTAGVATSAGSRVYFRHVTASGAVDFEAAAGDGSKPESMPKVVRTSNTVNPEYVVSYRVKESTGKYRLETTRYRYTASTATYSVLYSEVDAFGVNYYDISEYSITPDDVTLTYIAIIDQVNSSDTWNNVDVTQPTASGIPNFATTAWPVTICNDNTGFKWNPIARYVASVGRIDVAWGDPRGHQIYVQSWNLDPDNDDGGFPSNGSWVSNGTLETGLNPEFYMETCTGIFPAPTGAVVDYEVFFFRSGPPSNTTMMAHGYDLSGPGVPGVLWNASFGTPTTKYRARLRPSPSLPAHVSILCFYMLMKLLVRH